MTEVLRELPELTLAHLRLSLLALALAASGSIPLGIAAARRPRLGRVVLGVVGVVQTIPSLALLAIMVPTLAAIGALLSPALGVAPPAIGAFPATLALTLYGMLPILANTVAGIRGVDPAVLEAADGVGMTRAERLRRVELPLAAPVIMAGLRTATVWVVGTATLATPIGATSLGNLIFGGLQTRNVAAIVAGCFAAAMLAIVLDAGVAALERAFRARDVARRVLAVSALAATTAVLLVGGLAGRGSDGVVRVGAKPFTEQVILAEILGRHVAHETGGHSRVLSSLGSTVLFDGLAAGEIDAAVDYAGTLWTTILERRDAPPDSERMLEEIGDELWRRHRVRLLAPLGFENAYALAMSGAVARDGGLETVSDLARRARDLSIGADYEFFSRPEWTALERSYGLAFRERRTMDPSLLYEAVAAGAVDVIAAYSSDGRIRAYDLEILEDDRGVIPPYDALILVSERFERERPAAVTALRALGGRIDAPTMRRLNAAVDRDGESAGSVASRWLVDLWRSEPGRASIAR